MRRIGSYTALGLWAFVCLAPLVWLLTISLQWPVDFGSGPLFLPFVDFVPTLAYWHDLLGDLAADALRPLETSVIVTVISALLTVAIALPAVYALTRVPLRVPLATLLACGAGALGFATATVLGGVDWPLALVVAVAGTVAGRAALRRLCLRRVGGGAILFIIIATRIVPPAILSGPLYFIFQRTGLLDTRASLVLSDVALNAPVAIWLLRNAMEAIPREIEEAARIDGATRFLILRRIVLPLTAPAVAVTLLVVAVLAWGEYPIAAVIATDRSQTLPAFLSGQIAVREQASVTEPHFAYIAALVLTMLVPMALVAALMQRLVGRHLLGSMRRT